MGRSFTLRPRTPEQARKHKFVGALCLAFGLGLIVAVTIAFSMGVEANTALWWTSLAGIACVALAVLLPKDTAVPIDDDSQYWK